MKVKLFAGQEKVRGRTESTRRTQRMEAEINDWLSDNPQITVRFIEQSAAGGSLLASQWLISVWYDETGN